MGGEGMTEGVRLAERHISAARITRGKPAAAVSVGGLITGKDAIRQQRGGPETSRQTIGFPHQADRQRSTDTGTGTGMLPGVERPIQVLTRVLPALDGPEIQQAVMAFDLDTGVAEPALITRLPAGGAGNAPEAGKSSSDRTETLAQQQASHHRDQQHEMSMINDRRVIRRNDISWAWGRARPSTRD